MGLFNSILGWWRRRPPVSLPTPSTPPGPDPGNVSASLLAAHNMARVARGLPALRLDPRLAVSAQAAADACARAGRLDHNAGGQTPWQRIAAAGYRYREASENLAEGQRSAAEAVNAWLSDPPHAANVLGPHWRDVGFGYAAGYWAADYGAPA